MTKISYLFTVSINKYVASHNTIDDQYDRVCIPNKIEKMNVNALSLITEVNERRFLVQHGSCLCKCGSNVSVCSSKQKLNHNQCRCECKELDD